MGIFDWIILAFIVVSMWMGWRKGLIGMVVSFAGVILSFYLIGKYFPLVKNGLIIKFGWGNVIATISAVLLIVLLLIIIVTIVIWLLNKTLKILHLSSINKIMGTLLGFVNGLLVVIIVSVVIDYVPFISRNLQDSNKHRVYGSIEIVKKELFGVLKITQPQLVIKPLIKPKQLPTKKTDRIKK